ncbi:hypothetical protein LCGC14_0462210 [marine sediment metagenome]|uniref:Uncharacterized protein n=1 Tax=marine sediment metagenome TaxID=412755 RepID=A0A0F9SXM0_9ZZZZ
MKKPTSKEIQKGLNQLVGIKFLQKKDGKYKFNPNYKKVLKTCKGKSKIEVLIEALYKSGYFATPKTEREITIVCELLLLKKPRK